MPHVTENMEASTLPITRQTPAPLPPERPRNTVGASVPGLQGCTVPPPSVGGDMTKTGASAAPSLHITPSSTYFHSVAPMQAPAVIKVTLELHSVAIRASPCACSPWAPGMHRSPERRGHPPVSTVLHGCKLLRLGDIGITQCCYRSKPLWVQSLGSRDAPFPSLERRGT